MSDLPSIMICGHGSRDKGAVEEFNQLAVRIKERLPEHNIESGFLEFATPVIGEGLDKLRDAGAKKIVCLPGMLFAAGHVKNDLPSEINNYAADNDGLELIFAADLSSTQASWMPLNSVSKKPWTLPITMCPAKTRCCWWSDAAPTIQMRTPT